MSDLAALGSTQRIVSQVADQSMQLLLLGVIGGTNLALELLGSVDAADVQSRRQLRLAGVDAMAVTIASQQHHVQTVRSDVQVGGAGALVLLTSIQNGVDHGLGLNEVLAKVSASIGALQLSLQSRGVNVDVNGIQLVIQPDRTDVLGRDLVLSALFATVAQHDSSGQLLVQLHTIDVVQVLDIIEIGDVDNVITMQSALNVHSLRISGTANQAEVAGLLLLLALRVAVSAQGVDVTNVDLAGTDTGDGALMNLVHDDGNPALIVGDQLRSAGTNLLVLGEQVVDVTTALLNEAAGNCIVLQIVVVSIDLQSSLEAANLGALSHSQNILLVRVAQEVALSLSIIVENIVLHVIFLLVFFIGDAGLFQCLADHSVHDGLLLLGHRINDILNSLLAAFGLLGIFCHFSILLFLSRLFGLSFARVANDNGALIIACNEAILTILAMGHHEIDIGSGVCSCKDKAQLTNLAMNDILAHLLKLVGIDRQRSYIAMLHESLSRLSSFGVVERAIGINAIITILQQGMAQNILRIVMLVVPYQRYGTTIIVLECITSDSPAIAAQQIVSGCPSAKIVIFHFDVSSFFIILVQSEASAARFPPVGLDCY